MPTFPQDGATSFGTSNAPGAAALTRSVTLLTASQIVQLDGTAVTLVPAPGAGFMIVPDFAVVNISAGANATTDAGGNIQFNIGTRLYNMSKAAFTCTAANNAHTTYSFPEAISTAGAPPTDENAALTLNKAGNNVANTGNTCSGSVEVYFRIVQIVPTVVQS